MKLVHDDLIKKWEELRLKAYKPTRDDVWTIGWGHTDGVHEGQIITKQVAQKFFEDDVAWAEEAVNRLVKVKLHQNQFDALVSLAFNIGETAFTKSTLLKKLNAGDTQGAASEFLRWNKQKGKILNGLTNRRAEEMTLFLDINDTDMPLVAEGPDPMRSLMASKEVWAGTGGLLSGVGGLLAMVPAENAYTLSLVLVGLLMAIGAFVLINRIVVRKKGIR